MRDQQTTTNPPEACAQNPDWRQDLSYALIESLMAEPEEQAKAFLKAHLERLPTTNASGSHMRTSSS